MNSIKPTLALSNLSNYQQISIDVLQEKYLKGSDETQEDIFRRVAKALASVEKVENQQKFEKAFFENMQRGAIGAGRIMSSAGTAINSTLINCFVQPVGDSIQGVDGDGYPGIYEALRFAAETMRRGGGVGYDFSRIRPRGADVKGTSSMASGPCSYINVFDQSCSTVESAGARRGAQMGVLRIDHPDIIEFITAKRTPGRWNNFNVSVGVSQKFMLAVQNDESWNLVHKAQPCQQKIVEGSYYNPTENHWVYQTVQAKSLWDTIMQSTYDFAEPGIIFLDNMNSDNNLRYCETIEACNPCAEQPLPKYGCCDLGPIILPKFVKNPFGLNGKPPEFDFYSFEQSVALQVRALDNVLDITFWPLNEQKEESDKKRRIGVGFTGLGNTLTMLKLKYNDELARDFAVKIAKSMRDCAYQASIDLAKERGSFPLFDAEKYLESGTFASRLPTRIKNSIIKHGIRNSHLLSVAPTGTVSLAFADNASNGIEPSFSWTYTRKKRTSTGGHIDYQVEDHAWRVYRELGGNVNKLPEYFISALQMSAQDHIAMLEVVQPYIDSAISKTVNIPVDYSYENFKDLYMQAWQSNLKGLATYRPNSTLGAVLSETSKKEIQKPDVDPMRTVIENRPKGALSSVTDKVDYWTQDGQKTLYISVSFIPVKSSTGVKERAIEFFMPVGQNGESQQWITSSMRLLSLAARGGFLNRALNDMLKVAWDRGPVRLGFHTKEDGTKVPKWHDSEVGAVAYAIQTIINNRENNIEQQGTDVVIESNQDVQISAGKKCDECGAHAVIKKDGCSYCTACKTTGSCG